MPMYSLPTANVALHDDFSPGDDADMSLSRSLKDLAKYW